MTSSHVKLSFTLRRITDPYIYKSILAKHAFYQGKGVESYCSFYIPRYGLCALWMDSFFIVSEMTDKTRRVAPAQYEPQTEQSPTFAAEKKGPGLL